MVTSHADAILSVLIVRAEARMMPCGAPRAAVAVDDGAQIPLNVIKYARRGFALGEAETEKGLLILLLPVLCGVSSAVHGLLELAAHARC